MNLNVLCNIARTLCRNVFQTLPLADRREVTKNTFQKKFKLLTAVAGFDYKSTYYQSQVRPKFVYGDNACFVENSDVADVLGVADGVGGWRSYGVDPSQFPAQLMCCCARIVRRGLHFNPTMPVQLISKGYHELLDLKIPYVGSATVCVVSLCRRECRLYTAHLGNAGFLVLRRGDVLARSAPSAHQQHSFNTPFQLASLPPALHPELFHQDAPEAAARDSVVVEPGDLVVLATDGLFDNLSEPMIIEEIGTVSQLDVNLQLCADRLVSKAKSMWHRSDIVSPFAHEAQRHGYTYTGGKPGDITVVLALVAFDLVASSSTRLTSLTVTESQQRLQQLID